VGRGHTPSRAPARLNGPHAPDNDVPLPRRHRHHGPRARAGPHDGRPGHRRQALRLDDRHDRQARPRPLPPHRHGQGQGAQTIKTACLTDLTTAGTIRTGHTNPADWAGLHATGTTSPTGVPGIQVDGYFPDTSTTNTNNGWQHDSQFVLRIPDAWNGKLVVSGAPGNRAQYANDVILSDWVLAQGYAFASTDKGNVGLDFWGDGSTPGGSVREWNHRVTQLTEAAQDTIRRVRAGQVQRTYMAGISNGGYLVRWQLENRPDLYDGGLDWEGVLFRADGPNLLTYLPTALKNDPTYAAGGPGAQAAHDAMIAAVHDAIRSVELTGRLDKPLISLQGDTDTLLPIATDQDVYAALVADTGRGGAHAAYRIEGGTHTDGFAAIFPDRLADAAVCADRVQRADRLGGEGHRTPGRG
jgi:hypothetical protein